MKLNEVQKKIQNLRKRSEQISFELIEADDDNLLQLEVELDTIETELAIAEEQLDILTNEKE
jgi:hypothetical protein